MYKLVIVDDEYLVRLGIKETIDWNSYGIEVVGECVNGKEGLEMITKLQPDVVITDIKMPVMNGVELVAELKASNFKGEVVVLSGYKDFEYAKSTFENGIFSYVVKPIDNDELVQVILKAIKVMEEKKQAEVISSTVQTQLPSIQKDFLKVALSSDKVPESSLNEEYKNHQIEIPKQGVLLLVKLEEDYKEKVTDLSNFIQMIIQRLNAANHSSRHFDYQEEALIFIDNVSNNDLDSLIKESFVEFEQQTLTALTVSFFEYSNMNETRKSYKKCVESIESKLLFHLNTIETDCSDVISFRHRQSIKNFYRLISTKYDQGLTVKSVASELDVSESYIMHVLKDNLGKTFNEILTSYRIGIAKRLLMSGSYRINEVADMVGYSDVKYFSHVFKKIVGVTPSEYHGHDFK